MSITPERGNRKLSATREAQLLIVLTFGIAAWLQTDFQLFAVAVLGITGNLGLFSWANARVHAAAADKPTG